MGDGMLNADDRRRVEDDWHPVRLRLDEALAEAAARTPDHVGWVFDDERVTLSSMAGGAERLANALAQQGVGRNDTVAVWLPNTAVWAHALFACSRLGARLAAINTRAKAVEAGHILADSGAKVLLFRPRFLNIDYLAILGEIYPPIAARLLASTESADATWVLALSFGTKEGPILLERLLTTATTARAPESAGRPAPDAEAVLIQYTSGSTTMPKGALLHHVDVLNFGYHICTRMGVGPGESFLNTQPFYHTGGSCGCLPVPLLLRCTMVIPEYYAPERVLQLIERERCVSRTGMPTMYLREMQLPSFRSYDLSSLRTGWTIATPSVVDRIRAEFPLEGLLQLYGSTEAGSTCADMGDAWEVRRRSSGHPLPGTKFSIVDETTELDCPAGTTGEIRVAGWRCLLGYTGATHHDDVFDSKGRFRTGDLGHFDDAGELYFDGRLKDMIKPGGENVAALEVEEFLLQHPAIRQVAVVGVPDDDLGEAVMAIIEVVPGHSLDKAAVTAHCRGRIANFRIPKHVRFVTSWPMTGSGKLLKRELRARYVLELESLRQTETETTPCDLRSKQHSSKRARRRSHPIRASESRCAPPSPYRRISFGRRPPPYGSASPCDPTTVI
jgi:fatty-acyl-CoA synthase/long-chain acyl-CoA synthetase